MKAIGATKTQILTQFITEAAIIGLIGGTIGTIIGLIISYAVSFIALQNNFDLPIAIDLTTILGGISFAIITGIISGAYPAFKASNMDAVDALRK
jgi:ABC-type antimicrobial peptide transport system permease subunit